MTTIPLWKDILLACEIWYVSYTCVLHLHQRIHLLTDLKGWGVGDFDLFVLPKCLHNEGQRLVGMWFSRRYLNPFDCFQKLQGTYMSFPLPSQLSSTTTTRFASSRLFVDLHPCLKRSSGQCKTYGTCA